MNHQLAVTCLVRYPDANPGSRCLRESKVSHPAVRYRPTERLKTHSFSCTCVASSNTSRDEREDARVDVRTAPQFVCPHSTGLAIEGCLTGTIPSSLATKEPDKVILSQLKPITLSATVNSLPQSTAQDGSINKKTSKRRQEEDPDFQVQGVFQCRAEGGNHRYRAVAESCGFDKGYRR